MDPMIILDSNVWVFAEVKDAPEHPGALRGVRASMADAVGINVVVLSEVFHVVSRYFGASSASERVRTILSHPSIRWLEFSQDVGCDAMALAQEARLRINDALIAAQALDIKAAVLTDNVRDFRKVKGLKVLGLR